METTCPTCGAHTPAVKFCTSCGSPLPAPAPDPVPAPASQPAPPASGCSRCGAPRTSEAQRFCLQCGTALDAPAAAPPPTGFAPPPPGAYPPAAQPPAAYPPAPEPAYAAPVAAPGPPRRRRGRAVVVTLLALVLIGGAAAAGWWLLVRDADDPRAADDRTSADTTGSADPDGTPTTSPSASPSASASATPEPRVVTCWDGSSPTRVADCRTDPSGLDGLTWLYPSLDTSSCVDEKMAAAKAGLPDPAPLRREVWRCSVPLDGGMAKIFYYAWNDGTDEDRRLRYAEKFAYGDERTFTDRAGRVRRVLWTNDVPNDKGEYELTSMYTGLPYSMSVYAKAYADLQQALDDHVVFRAPSEIRGALR